MQCNGNEKVNPQDDKFMEKFRPMQLGNRREDGYNLHGLLLGCFHNDSKKIEK